MKWFLVAFIVYAENNQMDMKLNTALKFNNLERCEIYVKEFKPILEQGLRRSFPEMKEMSLLCVSGKEAVKLREKMLKKGLTK
tara:strand:+ start:326 stop:574 length:249 start_codon:yes stop_codon:yes gene_type:complete